MLEGQPLTDVTLEPLDDHIVVAPLDETETATGLIVPVNEAAQTRTGIVSAVGQDVDGVEPGDKVLYPRDAGFEGCDVDMGYAPWKGVSALRDLFETGGRKMQYGGWGVPDWRGEQTKAQEGLQQLPALAAAARELNIDHAATWIMPSSDRPLKIPSVA